MTAGGRSTRERILDTAFELTTAENSTGISMRRLADGCGLNVATIYHHFPSKADLLRAVLEERGYPRRMGEEGPPAGLVVEGDQPETVRRLMTWLWAQAEAEESAWRLLIGESLRGEPGAREEATRLVAMLEPAIVGWLGELLPDIGARAGRIAPVLRTTLLSLAVEHLALGPDAERVRSRVAAVVDVLPLDGG